MAVPLPATVVPVVVIVADMVTPPGPVSVKLKVPLPPKVFLVTTTFLFTATALALSERSSLPTLPSEKARTRMW